MGNLDHLSDDECRAELETIAAAMEGEGREYVHASGEREECSLAESVVARIAELEAKLAAHESLIHRVRAFMESSVAWPDNATFERADELVGEMLDATEESDGKAS